MHIWTLMHIPAFLYSKHGVNYFELFTWPNSFRIIIFRWWNSWNEALQFSNIILRHIVYEVLFYNTITFRILVALGCTQATNLMHKYCPMTWSNIYIYIRYILLTLFVLCILDKNISFADQKNYETDHHMSIVKQTNIFDDVVEVVESLSFNSFKSHFGYQNFSTSSHYNVPQEKVMFT